MLTSFYRSPCFLWRTIYILRWFYTTASWKRTIGYVVGSSEGDYTNDRRRIIVFAAKNLLSYIDYIFLHYHLISLSAINRPEFFLLPSRKKRQKSEFFKVFFCFL